MEDYFFVFDWHMNFKLILWNKDVLTSWLKLELERLLKTVWIYLQKCICSFLQRKLDEKERKKIILLIKESINHIENQLSLAMLPAVRCQPRTTPVQANVKIVA